MPLGHWVPSPDLDRVPNLDPHPDPEPEPNSQVEGLVLGIAHQAVGDALLPPILAALRAEVSRSLRDQGPGGGGGGVGGVTREWEDALRTWRVANAVLLDDGDMRTGFYGAAQAAAIRGPE